MKRKSILVLTIILMAIGFAAVSTTLFINGNTDVASNIQDFDVYFSKASLRFCIHVTFVLHKMTKN